MTLVFNKIEQAPLPFFLKPIVLPIARGISAQVKSSFINPNLNRIFNFIEKHLSQQTYFCGEELTAADFMMIFPLEAAASRAGELSDKPNIKRYVKAIHSRPAYKKALEKGGPYAYA